MPRQPRWLNYRRAAAYRVLSCGLIREWVTNPTPLSVTQHSSHFPALPYSYLSICISPFGCLSMRDSAMVMSADRCVRHSMFAFCCCLFLPMWLWEGYSVPLFSHMKKWVGWVWLSHELLHLFKGAWIVPAPHSGQQVWAIIIFVLLFLITPEAVGWKKTVEQLCPVNTSLLRSTRKHGVFQREETLNREDLIQPPLIYRWNIWSPNREYEFLRSTR